MDEQNAINVETESKPDIPFPMETVERVKSVCWAMNRMLGGLADERKTEVTLQKKEVLGLAGVFLQIVTDLEGIESALDPA